MESRVIRRMARLPNMGGGKFLASPGSTVPDLIGMGFISRFSRLPSHLGAGM
jgi:hypothetical protein